MMKEKSQRKNKMRGFREKAYKYMAVTLIVAMLISMVPVASVGAAAYSPFHDVATDYWGLQHITKSEIRGVISGYGNGIFKPEQTVTMLEAVIMAVNAMGLKDDTKTAYNIETSKYTLPTAWDASGYLAVALTEGLIRPNDVMAFRHDAGASRAWVALLLVRALGMDAELKENATTTFNDNASIPTWARPSVALASDKGIILGMAANDGGYEYRPNIAVKRAELATLISKSDRYMNDVKGQLPLGVIESVDTVAQTVTIVKTDKTKATYNTDATSALYDDNFVSKSVTLNNLQEEMTVRFYADGSKLKYMEQVNPSYYSNLPAVSKDDKLEVILVQHFPEHNELVVKGEDGSLDTYKYLANVAVNDRTNNETLKLDTLVVGDKLEIVIKNNSITQINVTKPKQESVLKGKIYALDQETGLITLEKDNKRSSYFIDDRVTVDYEGIRFASVKDLALGDEVALKLDNERVVNISVVKLYQDNINSYTGKLVEISTANKLITIETEDKTLHTYRYNEDTAIYVDRDKGKLADLTVGSQVTINLDKDKVIEKITIKNSIEGEVTAISKTNKTVTIKQDGVTAIYELTANADIQILEKLRAELDDLKVGMEVIAELDKDKLKKIAVKTTINTIVVKVDETWDRLEVQDPKDEDKTIRYYIYSDTELVVLGIDKPKLSDFQVNYGVKIDFIGYDMVKLEQETPKYGVVTSTTGTGDNTVITVVNAGTSYNINLDKKAEIYNIALTGAINPAKRVSPSNVKVNDYVRVLTLGDRVIVYLAQTTDVEFNAITTHSVGYYDDNRAYKNTSLDASSVIDLTIWQGTKFYLPGDLKAGSKVVLYSLDNKVVGIRVK